MKKKQTNIEKLLNVVLIPKQIFYGEINAKKYLKKRAKKEVLANNRRNNKRGLTLYDFGDVQIWALNVKNAVRKAENQGINTDMFLYGF